MTVGNVLLRFSIVYVLAIIAAGVVINLLALKGNAGLNVAALMAAVMYACLSFGKANGRYFDRAEKTRVFLGMTGIDVALQCALALLFVPSADGRMSTLALLGILAFVGALHAATIYFFIGMTGRMLEKSGYR